MQERPERVDQIEPGAAVDGRLAHRFEKLLENAADVILVLDEGGRLTYAAPSVRRVLGYGPDAHLGENVLTLVHPQDVASVAHAFRTAQAEPGAHTWIPFRVRHADGSWRDVEAASNVLLEEPSVRGIIVNLRDVSDQRRVEEDRAAMLGLLSHDLRTPLAVVIARAQLLRRRLGGRGTTDPAALCEDAALIEQTARRMEAMLEELVDLSRLQQGEALALNLAPLELGALVARLVAERRQLNPEHGLELDAPAAPLTVSADEPRIARAITNLLSNAAKYSASGSVISGRLAAVTDSAGCWAELSVQDRGIGIPVADLPHIGERYYRASNAAGHSDGTGLGLFGVHRIVEQHGGSVAIASTQDEGTRVTVRLPLSE